MTIKLVFEIENQKKYAAYVADDVYLLADKMMIKASESSIASIVYSAKNEDGMLTLKNQVIVNIFEKIEVSNIAPSYVDPTKITDLASPSILVYAPVKSDLKSDNVEPGYKLYFAQLVDC